MEPLRLVADEGSLGLYGQEAPVHHHPKTLGILLGHGEDVVSGVELLTSFIGELASIKVEAVSDGIQVVLLNEAPGP